MIEHFVEKTLHQRLIAGTAQQRRHLEGGGIRFAGDPAPALGIIFSRCHMGEHHAARRQKLHLVAVQRDGQARIDGGDTVQPPHRQLGRGGGIKDARCRERQSGGEHTCSQF